MQELSIARRTKRSLFARGSAKLRYVILTRVWGMDIAPDCEIESTAWLDRTWPKGVHIGAGAYIGAEAAIMTHDFTRGIYLDTRVGHGCIIGARAIIMPGCAVGDGSVVYPGAVVTRDVAAQSLVVGNPARTISSKIELGTSSGKAF